MKKILILIAPLIAVLCVFSLVEKIVKSETGDDSTSKGPPAMTCYVAVKPNTHEPTLEQLKSHLKSLEDAYDHKLIKEEAYQTRKETLLKKIQDKEKEE